MPRTGRSLAAGGYYHVINRGNDRGVVFHRSSDYRAFLNLIGEAQGRLALAVVAACLMPNHFHLVVSQQRGHDISRWMQWLLTTHSHRYHLCRGSTGRVWQGRFKAFPIEQDRHLLTVMRYVERNALRSGLVAKAEQWPWGSLAWRQDEQRRQLLSAPPFPLPSDWRTRVNAPQTTEELDAIRTCVNRQRPYGTDDWVHRTARNLGLESSMRGRGRPPRAPSQRFLVGGRTNDQDALRDIGNRGTAGEMENVPFSTGK